MSTRATNGRKVRDTYFELVRRFPLRPIRSERELDRATEVMDDLVSRPRLDPDEEDYLDVLSDLAEKYEEKHHPIPPASDSAMLQHLIQARSITQADVARATGIAVSTVCEVIAGKRPLRRPQFAALARFFHVSPAVFAFERP